MHSENMDKKETEMVKQYATEKKMKLQTDGSRQPSMQPAER